MKRKKKLKKYFRTFLFVVILILSVIGIYYYVQNKNKKNENDIDYTMNENKDNHKKEETMEEKFQKEKYYIAGNLDRYLDYIGLYPDKELEEVVTCVNANIDYDFYTHVVNTDLTKETLVLVNKYTKLESNYVPDLVTMESGYTSRNAKMNGEAYNHFKEMVDAAKEDNITLFNVSAYRSYATQEMLYQNYAKRDGTTKADTYSARPGYSEHQTGLASDINTASSSDHFENTKEYAWLQENAYKFGFILRYPKGKEYITGYKYEPWHYRYVGKEIAKYIQNYQITYEEYYAYFIASN